MFTRNQCLKLEIENKSLGEMSKMLTTLFMVIALITFTPAKGLPVQVPLSSNDQVMEAQPEESTQSPATPTTAMEPVDNCTGQLSRLQVEDIKSQRPDSLYAYINGMLIVKQQVLDIYIELYRIVSLNSDTTGSIDIWLSHVPCPDCIEALEFIFSYFTEKPVLHIESLHYKGSNYEVLRDIGCLAKLKDSGFQLTQWEWGQFSTTNGPSCSYYSTPAISTDYMTEKMHTMRLVEYFQQEYTTSTLAELCT